MTMTTHLAFYSRDGFFCKDGRGWYGARRLSSSAGILT